MKKIIFVSILCLMATLTVHAQRKDMYKMSKKVYGFADTFQYLRWNMRDYPASNYAFWCLPADTAKNLCAIEGTILIPQSVIDSWTNDDSVIPQWIEGQKPWANKNN